MALDAEHLRAIVRDELRRLLAPVLRDEPAHYSSRRGCGPVGVPEARWREIAATIGRKPYPSARWYVVGRGVYERWLAGETSAPATPANDAPAWDAGSVLDELGLRRGAR
jgi:hypothetical protein